MTVTSTTMTITAHFSGPHSGSERLEAWLRSAIYGGWNRLLDEAIGGASSLAAGPVIDLPPGVPHDVATRLTRSGAAQAGSTSADPMDWPAGHRQMAVPLTLDDPVDTGDSWMGDMLGAPGITGFHFFLVMTPSDSTELTPTGLGLDPSMPDIRYEIEADPGTGYVPANGFYDHILAAWQNLGHGRWYGDITVSAWNADVEAFDPTTIMLIAKIEDFAGETIDLRIRRVARKMDGTVLQTSNWLVFPALAVPA